MIFALAVCTRFSSEQCVQMVFDACRAIPIICTDGLKLLMLVKYCYIADGILKDEGNLCVHFNINNVWSIPNKSSLTCWT